jgi:hypothetical protein
MQASQYNVTPFIKGYYGNISNNRTQKNKANSKPIKVCPDKSHDFID